MRTIYFHEDDFCQIELLPAENLEWCTSETRRIDAFAEEHRADIGWTDVYVRSEPPTPLRSRGISVSEVRAALSAVLPPFDRVTTGYGTHVEHLTSTEAFGYENQIVVFAQSDQEIVTTIWLDVVPTTEESVSKARDSLSSFRQWRLLLVDWGWSVVSPLENSSDIAKYLEQRARVFSSSNAQTVPKPSDLTWLQRLRRWLGAV